jgi:hypothetical protein
MLAATAMGVTGMRHGVTKRDTLSGLAPLKYRNCHTVGD